MLSERYWMSESHLKYLLFFSICYYYHHYFIALQCWFFTYVNSNSENTFFGLSNLELFIESLYASNICLHVSFGFFLFFLSFFYIYIFIIVIIMIIIINPLSVCDVIWCVGGTCRKCVWRNITQIKHLEILALCLTKYCIHGPAVAINSTRRLCQLIKSKG